MAGLASLSFHVQHETVNVSVGMAGYLGFQILLDEIVDQVDHLFILWNFLRFLESRLYQIARHTNAVDELLVLIIQTG